MSKTPSEIFGSVHYQRHNARRLEHLARLSLPIEKTDVLELGSGPGDHTTFFLDRGCSVTAVEARQENLDLLNQRLNAKVSTVLGDLEHPDDVKVKPHSVVYCYGLLYHLSNPDAALTWMASRCEKMLLLETCVSFGAEEKLVAVKEQKDMASQSFSGAGTRPTRAWLYHRLNKLFAHVYVPVFQPYHEEFPTDWMRKDMWQSHARAIFIASRQPISNPLLLDFLPSHQTRG
ncbi:SAM-dependent methyltransferase [Mesorhizobium robiniae]|uniref:SAM-dependent methyltransferase n=1 Tax=Mesorhizobium robiniae TaxID=559315 RepID=A0ABV2GPC6_9HYPH